MDGWRARPGNRTLRSIAYFLFIISAKTYSSLAEFGVNGWNGVVNDERVVNLASSSDMLRLKENRLSTTKEHNRFRNITYFNANAMW